MIEETPVPDNSPLMIAWNAYKSSPEFTNTRYWALLPDHTNSSLWAAFVAGWNASKQDHSPEEQPAEAERLRMLIREYYCVDEFSTDDFVREAFGENAQKELIEIIHKGA